MTNHMVMKTFAVQDLPYSRKWDEALLTEAKNLVASLDAVFFLEDFENFAHAFGQAKLVDNTYINPNKKRCELGHSNPTTCSNCVAEPTAEEVELIKQHNTMDIELYAYAAALPNRLG